MPVWLKVLLAVCTALVVWMEVTVRGLAKEEIVLLLLFLATAWYGAWLISLYESGRITRRAMWLLGGGAWIIIRPIVLFLLRALVGGIFGDTAGAGGESAEQIRQLRRLADETQKLREEVQWSRRDRSGRPRWWRIGRG